MIRIIFHLFPSSLQHWFPFHLTLRSDSVFSCIVRLSEAQERRCQLVRRQGKSPALLCRARGVQSKISTSCQYIYHQCLFWPDRIFACSSFPQLCIKEYHLSNCSELCWSVSHCRIAPSYFHPGPNTYAAHSRSHQISLIISVRRPEISASGSGFY